MTPPTTDHELAAACRELVTWLLTHLVPGNVPCTPEAQSAFVNGALYQAHAIHRSEPFKRAEVMRALSEAQRTGHLSS